MKVCRRKHTLRINIQNFHFRRDVLINFRRNLLTCKVKKITQTSLHSYITVILCIHNRCDSACLLYRAPFRISVKCKNQRRYSWFCRRDVGQMVLPFASLSTKSAGMMELAQPVLDCRHAHTTAMEHFQWLLST